MHKVKAGFSLYPGQTMKDFPKKVSVNNDAHCAAASFPLQSSGAWDLQKVCNKQEMKTKHDPC